MRCLMVVFLGFLLMGCMSTKKNSEVVESQYVYDDSANYLTEEEGAFLNEYFKYRCRGFDFRNKKVMFTNVISNYNKRNYIGMLKRSINEPDSVFLPWMVLYTFDSIQKESACGYDGAILMWCKFHLPIEHIVGYIQRGWKQQLKERAKQAKRERKRNKK